MTTGVLATPPILQFALNNGQLAAGGSILTQVGGVNTATYADSGLTTPLPNPIPLNSRGEISDASGASRQLFLTPNLVYTLTLFDGPSGTGNQIWSATYVNGVQFALTAAAIDALSNSASILLSLDRTSGEIAASVTPVNYAYAPGNVLRYGTNTNPGSTDMTGAFSNALLSNSAVYVPTGTYLVTNQLTLQSNQSLYGDGSGSLINFSSSANTDFIVGSNVSNTTVRDLKLVATGLTTVMNYQGMVAFRGSTACKVLRCEIQGFYASGIVLNACQFCEVDSNYLHGSQGSLGSNSDIHVLTTASASSIS